MSVAFCSKLTDKGFANLQTNGLRNLSYLDLSGCYNITQIGIQYLTTHCAKIENLKLNGLGKLSDQHLKV